jgi:uncharacterized protein YceK
VLATTIIVGGCAAIMQSILTRDAALRKAAGAKSK